MKRILRFKLLFILAGLLIGIAVSAQENFADPIEIGELVGNYDCGSPHYMDTQNTSGFANDIGQSSPDVFYSFTLASQAKVTMDMCNSNFDTYIWLYNSSQTLVASNDDYCGLQSFLDVTIDPGLYYIVCEGFSSSTGTYNLEVYIEGQAPAPDLPVLPDLEGSCEVTVTDIPTGTSNCYGTVEGTTTDPLIYSDPGIYTITWTYAEGSYTTDQTQTVIVYDTIAPVPDVDPLPTIHDQCTHTVTDFPIAIDCGDTIVGTTTDPLTFTEQGEYMITWVYDDGYGNTSTQDQTVIIADVFAPVPDLDTLPALTGECSVNVVLTPVAWDNCDGLLSATTTDPYAYTEQGTYVITWQFEDAVGNTSEQLQAVIVDDITAPVPDVETLPEVSGECSATVTAVPTATDNCEGAITGTTDDPTTYDVVGTYTVTWAYDDGNGNIATQEQTVVVSDATDPVPDLASLPEISGDCSVTVSDIPTATDNCEGTITATTDDPLSYDVAGTYTITWTYEDLGGNAVTQTQSVVVTDAVDPVPDVSDLPAITAECSVTVSEFPTATDNCAGVLTATTDDPLEYTEQGTYTITWVYDDGNGNSVSQTQSVVIEDITAPVFTCPDDVVTCDGTVADIAPTGVEDNCSETTIRYTLSGATTATGSDDASGELFNAGLTTVEYTFVDAVGNTATCSFEVTYETVDVSVTQEDETLTANGTGDYQWIDCATEDPIAGETGQSFTAVESGSYAVIVSGANCSATSDCYTVEIVDGIKLLQTKDCKLYPNPTSGMITLEFGEQIAESLLILDIAGQEVYSETELNNKNVKIDLSDLEKGIYVIYLKYESYSDVIQIVKE